mmetsp:Transcript_89101/g.238635  ORF Transcript_89101/g.238635 Transcript_89101/m.238635 type:complete len:869 (-) Transcript_89101:249-2855(-)
MKTDIARVEEQLREAVEILTLNVKNLLDRDFSRIRTELRAISLADLSRLAQFIRDTTWTNGWIDTLTKKTVEKAEDVNLYHLVYNFVGPVTSPVGHEVADSALQLGPDGEAPGGEAHEIEHSRKRRFRYVRGFPPGVPKGQKDGFVRTFCGSFAELLCNDEREAHFFVSHWWGEPVLDFVACLEAHDAVHEGGGQSLYWVCAYANCQARIAEELGEEGPLASPFYKALTAATGGAVLVIDTNSTVTTRMWCGFENVVVASKGKSLAMATSVRGGGHVLTAAPAPADLGCTDEYGREVPPPTAHRERQAKFATERLDQALRTHLEGAVASNEQDLAMIIDCVNKDLGGFDRANSKLRVMAAVALFALGKVSSETVALLNEAQEPYHLVGLNSALAEAWSLGLRLRQCSSLTIDGEVGVEEVAALSEDFGPLENLTRVALDFHASTDVGVTAVGEGLRSLPNLTDLALKFPGCRGVGDVGMTALGRGLGFLKHLAAVELNFKGCKKVDDVGVAALCEGLGSLKNLTNLTLDLSYNNSVGNLGVTAVGQGLGFLKNLASIAVDFGNCNAVGDAGVTAVVEGIRSLPNLTEVMLHFASCFGVGDVGVTAVGEGLGSMKQLTTVAVDFSFCHGVSDVGVTAAGKGLGSLPNLTGVDLKFCSCKAVGDAGVAAVGESLGSMEKLTDLAVSFSWNSNIGDTGVAALSKDLASMKNLAGVALDFSSCENIGDAGVTALGEALGSLTNLAEVALRLENSGVDHAGWTSLAQQLGGLPNLAAVDVSNLPESDLELAAEALQGCTRLSKLTIRTEGTNFVGRNRKQVVETLQKLICPGDEAGAPPDSPSDDLLGGPRTEDGGSGGCSPSDLPPEAFEMF